MPDRVDLKEKVETTGSNDFDHGKIPAAPAKEEGAQDKVPDNGAWETQLFQVYNGRASLQYPHLEPGGFTEQYILEPGRLPLQEGVAVIPDTAQVSAYNTKERKGVVFTALGGSVEIAITNLPVAVLKAQLAVMNIISDRFIMDEISAPGMEPANLQQAEQEPEQAPIQTNDTEISAYLRGPIKIESLTGITIALDQGEYIKNKNDRDPKLKFWKTTLDFTAQKVQKECVTELDETGLHTMEKQNVPLDKQEADNISAEQVLESLNEPREQPEPEPQWEWKGFEPGDLTEDGFVRMEEAESQVVTVADKYKGQIGKAKFRFNEIPYTIPLFNKRELKGKTKPKEAGDTMQDFFVDLTGKLYVVFKEPIELSLIGNEKIEKYIVATIVLEGVSIKGSQLTAEKIRIDLGKKASQDEDEDEDEEEKGDQQDEQSDEVKAKKLFGKKIHGTFANTSAVSSIDKEGIHAAPGKKSLGEFGVSKFLGFLDVEGDYPTGYLKVSFEDQKKADKPKLFSETVQNLMGDGLCIPIFGPLAFEICISPSVSIGGSLSAEMRRGKSFGEKLEPGENMDLAGKAEINGEGKLDMSAGLALTPGILGSVKLDLKVGSELSAGIGVEAKADTALGLRDGKIKQTKDLNLDGGVNIKLKGQVNLSSNVKFFIWKGTLFKVELCSKEVNVQPFLGRAWRDVDAEGLMQGWHFEGMRLSAKELGQEIVQAIRDSKDLKKVDEKKLEMSEAAAKVLGEEAESAWAILEELNRQKALSKEYAYLTSEEEKAALQNRINTVTKEVEKKISKYMGALNEYKSQLYKKQEVTQRKLDDARKEHAHCMAQDTIRQMAMKNVQRGGLLFEKYLPLSQEESKEMSSKKIQKENEKRNKMAAIDFTIARALGIYDRAMDEQRYEYDMYAREQNSKNRVDKRQGKKSPELEYIYPLLKDIPELNFLKGSDKNDNYRWGGAEATLRYQTQFGRDAHEEERGYHINNYFHVLYYKSFYLGYIPASYRSDFIPIFKGKNAIRSYDFAKILLSGVYPQGACDGDGNSLEGKPIKSLDTDRKTKLFKTIFKDTLSKEDKKNNFLGKLFLGSDYNQETTQREKMMVDINKVLHEVFGSNLDDMVANGNIDMNEKLRELDDKLETSKEDYINAREKHYEVESAIKNVEKEQLKYEGKLFGLRYDVESGMKLDEGSVKAAKAAVNFMQNDYEAVAMGGELPDLAVVGFDEDSDAYKKMKKFEKEAFPERKNAAKALKAPVAV